MTATKTAAKRRTKPTKSQPEPIHVIHVIHDRNGEPVLWNCPECGVDRTLSTETCECGFQRPKLKEMLAASQSTVPETQAEAAAKEAVRNALIG
ncbi:MAG: hypothetical protein ACK5Q5_22430 [Planctomycetaceae bacterium]